MNSFTSSSNAAGSNSFLVLVLKAGVLVLLVAFSSVALYFLGHPISDDHYMKAILDKHARLKTTPSPKIVLIGDSNLAFGLNSRLLEQKASMAVVNVGLYSSLGLRYQLNEVLPYVGPGDILVVSPVYQNLFGDYLDGAEGRLGELLVASPEHIGYFSTWEQYESLMLSVVGIRNTKSYMLSMINLVRHGSLRSPFTGHEVRRSHFNEYGDYVAHLGLESTIDMENLSILSPFHADDVDGVIEALNQFHKDVIQRGAQAVLLYPPISTYHYEKQKDRLNDLHGRFLDEVTVPIPATPGDYSFPSDYFFDTAYHLNAVGREERTRRVISNLQPFLSGSPSQTNE